MANDCMVDLVVRGRKECVKEFDKIITADYDYSAMEFSHKPHFNRLRGVDHADYSEYGLMAIQSYVVDCAWSAEVCFMKGDCTYYGGREAKRLEDGTPNYSTNLEDVSKQYDLDIELWSQESGFEFEEHILIKKGEVIENEVYEYHEYYIEDYSTYNDFLEDYPNAKNFVSKEIFDYYKGRREVYILIEDDGAYDFEIDDFETDHGAEMCRVVDKKN